MILDETQYNARAKYDIGSGVILDFVLDCMIYFYSCGHVTITFIDGFKIYPLTVVPARHQTHYILCNVLMVFWGIYDLVGIFKKSCVECFIECYIWCDTVISEPKTQKQTLKRTSTTFNWMKYDSFGQILVKYRSKHSQVSKFVELF